MEISFTGVLVENMKVKKNDTLKLFYSGNRIKAANMDNELCIQNIKATDRKITNKIIISIIPQGTLLKVLDIKDTDGYQMVKLKTIDANVSKEEVKMNLSEDKNVSFIKKAIEDTKRYVSEMIDYNSLGTSGIDIDCLDAEAFPELEKIKINKYCCMYDSRILLPEANYEEYVDGCRSHCAKSTLEEYPTIRKRVLQRFLRNLERGIYDEIYNGQSPEKELPPLLTDKELEFINTSQKDKMNKWERRLNLRDKIYKQTKENRRKNMICFYGNNLNPIPMELFKLWRDLSVEYEYATNRYLRNQNSTENTNTNWELLQSSLQEYNGFSHYEGINSKTGEDYYLFDFNTSIGISLYVDEELQEEIFYMTIQDSPIDMIDFENKNQIITYADSYLKLIYEQWKQFKENNKNILNKPYRNNQHKNKLNQDDLSMDFVCENCLIKDSCSQERCYYGKEDFDMLKSERYKINLYIHKLNNPFLPLNYWKHIVDNLTSVINVNEFNICGDEPLLYPDLIPLAKYIGALGIDCSLETSGLFMDEQWIKKNIKYFKDFTFAIDSFVPDILVILGRVNKNGEYISKDKLIQLSYIIKKYHPECKIRVETKICQPNKYEHMSPIFQEICYPLSMWKIVKYEVNEGDFLRFVDGNISRIIKDLSIPDNKKDKTLNIYSTIYGMDIMLEDETNNFFFIDNNGYLIKKENNRSKEIINCATETFIEDLVKLKIKFFND